ncbi:MAG TPA: peptidylprolyl isomerase [Nevskiaceae bacterium]|nr:peptidylprolyl isomerase [Nevskiaceae bacterium]
MFGAVTEGLDVVDKIAGTPTGNLPPFGRDVPVTAVVIKKATVVE